MKTLLTITLILVSLAQAEGVKIGDLKQAAMQDTPRYVAEAVDNLTAITFFDALDTAMKKTPGILNVSKNSEGTVTYTLHVSSFLFTKTVTFHSSRDAGGVSKDLASTELAKFLALKTSGGKYGAFRESYLSSIMWNIRFPSFIPKGIMDIMIDSLNVRELPEYRKALKDAVAPPHAIVEIALDSAMKEMPGIVIKNGNKYVLRHSRRTLDEMGWFMCSDTLKNIGGKYNDFRECYVKAFKTAKEEHNALMGEVWKVVKKELNIPDTVPEQY